MWSSSQGLGFLRVQVSGCRVVGTRAGDCREVSGISGLMGGGGTGGDKNVIHIASIPKTLVFTAFSPLCTTC